MNRFQNFIRYFAAALILLAAAGIFAEEQGTPFALPSENEAAELSAVLGDANRPFTEKLNACRAVARKGSAASVPVLAPYLIDRELSHAARIALLQIPGGEAESALIAALAADPPAELLPGLIRTLGARESAKTSDKISAAIRPFLAHDAPEIFSAASEILAEIGGKENAEALENAWSDGKNRVPLANALLTLAAAAAEREDPETAKRLYHLLADETSLPDGLRAAAATGQIVLADDADRLKLFHEAFDSSDRVIAAAALGTIPSLDPALLAADFMERFGQFDERRKLIALEELKRLRQKSSVEFLLSLATDDAPVPVRLRAISALSAAADAKIAPPLFAAVNDAGKINWDLVVAMLHCLGEIDDPAMDELTLAMLRQGEGPFRSFMINLAKERRLGAAKDIYLSELSSSDKWIRLAASQACAATMSADDLPSLFEILPDKSGDVRQSILDTIQQVGGMSADREKAARLIIERIESFDAPTREILFGVLAETRSGVALKYLLDAAKDPKSPVRAESLTALGRWPDAGAAPGLLDAARTLDDETLQVRAVRGYLRIIRQMDIGNAEKLKMADEILPVIRRDEERGLWIRALGRVKCRESFDRVRPSLEEPSVRPAAEAAIIEMVQGLDRNTPEIRAAFERIARESADESLRAQAADILNGLDVGAR